MCMRQAALMLNRPDLQSDKHENISAGLYVTEEVSQHLIPPLACHQTPSRYNKNLTLLTEVHFTGLRGARSGCRWAWWLCLERWQ